MGLKASFMNEHEDILNQIARREGLLSLNQFNDCKFDGRNAWELITLAAKTRQRLKAGGSVEWDWIADDLVNEVQTDIVYSLKNVYLYLPGINDFTKENTMTPYGNFPRYSQTLEDKRFLYFSGVCLEKLYAFWDRIGDLLCLAFGLPFESEKIYFAPVIDNLVSRSEIASSHLDWLKSFKADGYYRLNAKRKRVVHTRGLQSHFRKQHLIGCLNKVDADFWWNLQAEKVGLPQFLKEQLLLTIDGFEQAVMFISNMEDR